MKKILRVILCFGAGILLLLGISYALLRSPFFQTKLVRLITDRIEYTTGVKIQIGGVDFRPMRSLVLNEVLLRDFKNDTLVYCKDLQVKIDSFDFVNKSFTVREVLFDRAYFHLWTGRSSAGSATNMEMFIDSLQRADTIRHTVQAEQPAGLTWRVGLKKIGIRRSRFTYKEEEYEPEEYGVNWTDVDCRDLNVDVTGFRFGEEETVITVAGLSFVEKSGLRMKELNGKVKIRSNNLVITEGKIELERSNVDLVKLEFNWIPNQHDWRYFTTRMQQYYELGPSSVSFIDLAYFNGVLRGITNTVKCSGIVSNTINKLEGKDLYFELGERSIFQGSFKSSGLPDVWNTVFDIELHKAHLNPDDLETIYLPWFDMNIPVPDPFHHLTYLDFNQIKFKGTLSDFLVKAQSITPALTGDFTFAYQAVDSLNYDKMWGDYQFETVDYGKLAGLSLLGYGNLSGTYSGIWKDGPDFHVKGKANRLGFKKGNIQNIDLFLTWEDEKVDVFLSAEGREVQGNVAVTMDFLDSLDFVSVKGNVSVNELEKLGLALKGEGEAAGGTIDLVYTGKEEKGFTSLIVSDLHYSSPQGGFMIEKINLEDYKTGDKNTTVILSDVLDATLNGNYKDVSWTSLSSGMLYHYLPAYAKSKGIRPGKIGNADFSYDIYIKDLNRMLEVVYPDLRIAEGTHIASFFRSKSMNLDLAIISDSIQYGDFHIRNSKVDIKSDEKKFELKYLADKIGYDNWYQLYNVRNNTSIAFDRIQNSLSWGNWEDATYCGRLDAEASFQAAGSDQYLTNIQIKPGTIVMADSVWRVNKSSISILGKQVEVHDFLISKENVYLSVDGRLSPNPEEKLFIDLHQFNLRYLTKILLNQRAGLFGMVTGNLTIQDYYKDCLLMSDLNVLNWGIRQDTMGSLRLRSYWDAGSRRIIVGAENRIDNKIPLDIAGYYIPAQDTLNVDVRLQQVNLDRLGNYANEYISATTGKLSGDVHISGSLRRPDISGFVYLDSVSMNVNLLNTRFGMHDSIRIVKNQWLFKNFRLKDVAGHTSVLNGNYQIWENKYKLNIKSSDFMVLNTNFSDNEMFYGQVYLSGVTELDNHDGLTNVTVNAQTEENSRIYLPLTAGVTEEANNFLHFINREQIGKHTFKNKTDYGDINLNANLELNNHLEVQVIFDPTVGDILKTSGEGGIQLTFDKDGNLNMFGEYRVSKGDYLFTLSNLVNKKFVLQPGGTITWSGSPYDALLNLNAVYNLKTSVSELLPDQAGSDQDQGGEMVTDVGKKVPVECILNLSDHLVNPLIKFDISFPTLETQTKSYIQSLFSSQDEINKQMFSLLVLNKFYRTDNGFDPGDQAQTASVTTLTEMLSNQLSRWLSQISNNVDIGLAYRVGDREITTDEIEVALSTQLLNDRVTISANGNMDVGNRNMTDKKTNIAGDFDVEVKLNKPGSLKLKAYSHTDEKLIYNRTETIQGVGVSYQESFDTFRELLRKYFSFLRRKKK